MTFEIKSVPIRQLILDSGNPRHDPIDNERDIISHLVRTENVKALASDIARQGGLSPLDRVGVFRDPTKPNHYIALEGNRRVCALKLLADPEKAPNEPAKKVFRSLKAGLKTPLISVEAVVFESRAAARHWLKLRHEGALGGVGTKSWQAQQIARFNKSEGSGDNPNVLAVELLDYAYLRKLISSEQRKAVAVTTLTRYLSSPVVRNTLALTSNRSLRTDADQTEFDKGIKRFLEDALLPGGPVSSRSTKSQRENYAKRLVREGFSPSNRDESDARVNPETGRVEGKPTKKPARKRDNRSPDDRITVIPSSFGCHISGPVHKRVYDELKKIDAEEFSFSAAYLFRAFVELSTAAYCQKHQIQVKKGELDRTMQRVADHLAQHYGVRAPELKGYRVMAQERDSSYSPETLGSSVHGGLTPTRVQLVRAWDNVAPALTQILERI